MGGNSSLGHPIRDDIIYLLAGLAVVFLSIYLAVHPPKHPIAFKWIQLSLATAVVFGILIQSYWGHRKSVKLWLVLASLLATHISIFSIVLSRWNVHLPILVQTLLYTGEYIFLAAAMYWILGAIPHFKTR